MYSCIINPDNSFTILDFGVPVYTSQPFRLQCQAEEKAKDWMNEHIGRVPDQNSVTLEVQNVSVDAKSLFQRRR